jgi:hypothetical protein
MPKKTRAKPGPRSGQKRRRKVLDLPAKTVTRRDSESVKGGIIGVLVNRNTT